MLGINSRGAPWWLVERIAHQLNRKAPSTEFVWGMADRDQLKLPFAQQIVTSDPERYARTQALLAADPELRLNGPTWGWLAAALRCHRADAQPRLCRSYRRRRACCSAPGRDRVCDTDAVRAFAARMPHAQFVEIADAEHEILMERDIFRAQFWSAFDRFHVKKTPQRFPAEARFSILTYCG